MDFGETVTFFTYLSANTEVITLINRFNHEISARSRELSLLFNGRIINALAPWHIIVDTDEETITIRKRNYSLIGVDEEVFSFRFVRLVTIDEHLIGADLEIKVVGGTAKVYCLSKSDCQRIKKCS